MVHRSMPSALATSGHESLAHLGRLRSYFLFPSSFVNTMVHLYTFGWSRIFFKNFADLFIHGIYFAINTVSLFENRKKKRTPETCICSCLIICPTFARGTLALAQRLLRLLCRIFPTSVCAFCLLFILALFHSEHDSWLRALSGSIVANPHVECHIGA